MKIKFKNKIFQFKKLELKDKPFFETKYSTHFISCEYSFVNLFIWSDSYAIKWSDFYGVPLILNEVDNILFFPLKKISPEELACLSQEFKKSGGSGIIGYIPEEYVKNNQKLNDFFKCDMNRDYAEYIHSTERLVALSGRKLSKKKNHITQFHNLFESFELVNVFPDKIRMCMDLSALNAVEGNSNHAKEILALKKAAKYFDELELDGRMILVNGKCAAFSIFSKHIDETCLIHFEKSNYDYKGASQAINRITAKYLFEKYQCKYLNREQDLGVDGLRKNKLSYDPDIILNPCFLTPI